MTQAQHCNMHTTQLELISVDGDKGTATVTINKSELRSDYESFLTDDSDSIEIYYCPECGKRLHKNTNLKLNSDIKNEKCPYCQGEHLPLLEVDGMKATMQLLQLLLHLN